MSIPWPQRIFWSSVALVLPALVLLPIAAKRETIVPVNARVATVGGLQYRSVQGRPLDPSNPVDARILKGLPAAERPAGKRDVLFGAFVTIANGSARRLPTADRIELRDDALRVHKPLRLPAGNPYAYRPQTLSPGAQVPRFGTPAADNLAAGGELLLFRVSAWRYRNGGFELVVHDPLHPGVTRTVQL
jgi:hypothetical protein